MSYGENCITKGILKMAKIVTRSREMYELFRITKQLEEKLNLSDEEVDTVLYLINTTERLQALKEWVESKTQNGKLMSNEDELLNVVSRIHREKKE